MSEDNLAETQSAPASPTFDAAGWAALSAADREHANAFLEQQRKVAVEQEILVRLQSRELAHELQLRHWSLRVRHVSDLLKLGFELAVAFIVIALAVGIGAVILQAANAEGLVIRSFEVPAALAAKGLSGDVVANKLLDRLTVMQEETDSTRAASSFANDWTNDIKVEIPDTGISLGEAVRFLQDRLGHEMHLSGELSETPDGIALTVRMDNEPGLTFEGNARDLGSIVGRAAEAVFARAQPYRYQVYLSNRRRFAESDAAGRSLVAHGPSNDAAWAYVGLGINTSYTGRIDVARRYFDAARRSNPALPNPDASQSVMDRVLSHEQDALNDMRRGMALMQGRGAHEWNPADVGPALKSYDGYQAGLEGDFAAALADNVATAGSGGAQTHAFRNVFLALLMHDIAAARRFVSDLDDVRTASDAAPFATIAHGQFLVATHDWQGAIAQFDSATHSLQETERKTNGWRNAAITLRANASPYEARAYAMLGDFDKADAILKTSPADCDLCARAHGQIEALRKNWSAAAGWFRLVSARSPDIPFADSEWGRMLLEKGDVEGAIGHFAIAHARGPHFADPLEMWGEALMQQNRSDLALAKFEEADKYAPNWGRLHLKWGEALGYAGKRDDGKKQLAIAAALDLTAAERAELSANARR
jgi:tetratricopeptide (TPR) repeat protein